MNQLIVFTLDGCSHCVDLKKKLSKNKLEFREIEIGANKNIWDKVVEQTGHNSLPTVYIQLNGGEEGLVFVPERDYKDHDELIEQIKNHI